MLLSMTGFGEAHSHREGLALSVEVRTINSRFFKAAIRTPEGYGGFEPQIEAIVRKHVRRGTIQVNVRVDQSHRPEDYKINAEVFRRYRAQIAALAAPGEDAEHVPLSTLLLLPGVVDERASTTGDPADDWPLMAEAVEAALTNLAAMRLKEGQTMAGDLRVNCNMIAAGLAEVERRAPKVVDAYRAKLEERLQKILTEFQLTLNSTDLIKEVSMMADRADISEEIVRLRSHLEQFETIMNASESAGRKLEFLTQEMVRETNTIGSKAGDLEIARHVIEMKAATERIREMIQNIE